MQKSLKILLSIALATTLIHAKIYEDGEDGKIEGWRTLGNGSVLNIDVEGNRYIQLSGEKRNNVYILGGTNSIRDKEYKWDAREGKKLSWRMKFEKKPEIYIPIKTAHKSDTIRYIRYVSSSDNDESGWNHSGSILTIKIPQKFEGEDWVTINRDIEKDLQSYRHPNDPTQNELIAINGFMVVGLGMVDDIEIETSTNIPNDYPSTAITREALREMIINGEDVTRVNTSEITNMGYLISPYLDSDEWWKEDPTLTEEQKNNIRNFNQDISLWDTSNVTNMRGMFWDATSFNQELDNWDVSNVTNMQGMFAYTEAFNQPLNSWDVSNVTNMQGMFSYTKTFNQALDNWDTSKVRNMSLMFQSTQAFNQPLNNWDLSNVNYTTGMFMSAQAFNQPLDNWDTSKVSDMQLMFARSKTFNQPLNSWNVDNVKFYDDFAINSALEDNYNPFK